MKKGTSASRRGQGRGESGSRAGRYSAMFEENHAVMLLVDPDTGGIVDANPSACRFYGWSREQLAGMHIGDINLLGREGVVPEIGKASRGLQNRFLFRHRLADGRVREVEVNTGPVRTGRRTLLCSIIQDVTEARKAEQATRAEHGQFLSICESLAEPIYVADPETHEILYANMALKRQLGEVLGKKCFRILQGLDAPCSFCTNPMIFGENVGRSCEWEHHNPKNGRWYRCFDRAIRWPDGRMVRCEIAFDVTARKRDEEALRESVEQFKELAENSPNMIFINCRGKVVYANARCQEIMGYSREEFLSPAFGFLSLMTPDSLATVREAFARHGRGEDVKPYEYGLVTRDGRRLEAIISTKLIKYGGQEAILGVVTDITERKRMEEALRAAKEELEKQNEELKKLDKIKDSLIRDVTHELKTPVAKQSMQLELLRDLLGSHGLLEEAGRILSVMESSVRRQEKAIGNILDLSRLEAGGRESLREPMRLDGLVREVLEDHRGDFAAHGVEVVEKLEEVEIESDRDMLWHVVSNVVGNAVKFKGGQDRPRLEVTLVRESGRAVLSIADNGIGLSEDERKRVFSRFFKATPSIEGSGVGLSISRRIVEDLGGSIAMESPGRGRGATVVITLPLEALGG